MSTAAYLDEWHSALGEPPGEALDQPLVRGLRQRLIMEEAAETDEALMLHGLGRGPLEDLAKELADLVYVCYGAARAYNIPLDAVIKAVHESNMTKLVAASRRPDGKIEKGPHYVEPDIRSILYDGSRESPECLS